MANHPQAMQELRAILDSREPIYARARIVADTSWRVPEEVAAAIEAELSGLRNTV